MTQEESRELRQFCLGNVNFEQPLKVRMYEAEALFRWLADRPAPSDLTKIEVVLSNQAVKDLLVEFNYDIVNSVSSYLQAYRDTINLGEKESVEFTIVPHQTSGGLISFNVVGEKKSLTNSKKK